MRVSNPRGFTLIELLIVVAIISVLAAIATPNFLEAQTRAKVSRSCSDLRALAAAIETYGVDWSRYPPNGVLNRDGSFENPQRSAAVPPAHKFLHEGVTTPIAYVTRVFTDPFIDAAEAPEEWQPYVTRYFYTNLDWFAALTSPGSPPVIAQMKEVYGTWILSGAGPDRDRLDLSRHVFYDPTNGTISDGDLLRSARFAPD